MFGKEMFGIEDIKVDSKGRIILPSFTNAEPGDNILLVKDSEFYSLYNQEVFDEIFRRFEETNDINILRSISKCIHKQMKVDAYKRITLGTKFKDNEYLQVIGCRKFVAIREVKKR